jgi:uncharacterized protein YjiS (DUF1127 family)
MTTLRSTYTARAMRPGFPSRLRSATYSAWRTFAEWYERRAAARHLASLDDRMLKDIGITRGEVMSVITDGRPHRNRYALPPLSPMTPANRVEGRPIIHPDINRSFTHSENLISAPPSVGLKCVEQPALTSG